MRTWVRRIPLRWVGIPFLGVVVAAFAYCLAALALGLIPINRSYRPDDGGVDVYMVGNGVHTDLVVPIQADDVDWRLRLPMDAFRLVGAENVLATDLAFGWGDRGFYLATPIWSDLRFETAFKALTGLDTSVLHVTAARPPRPGPSIRHLRLTAVQYRQLAAFIDASFQVDSAGSKIVIPGARYGAHDAFFEAFGHYSMFVTCNEWTREALAAAGVRVPVWAPFDTALFFQISPDN